ncbi:MAG: hypothetical protein OQK09_08835 [Colwellia sp.]|nr:hypothetical protein [Colwellia sp.]MCW9081605.1 hypothetical protein [Colwellia sp.]
MTTFDQIVMIVGCALIVIGLILFVMRKKESSHSDHVEGFGIKLNVSNPSIILIILGSGLLLVPRLLPQNSTATQPQIPNQADKMKVEPISTEQPVIDNTSISTNKQQSRPRAVEPSVYFPTGQWQLSSYEENGINLSANIRGTLVFTKQSDTVYRWSSDFVFMNDWGNMVNYQYQGTTSFTRNAYEISFLSSTDPSFSPQHSIPLELKLENGVQLHMKYWYDNSQILLHWLKSN